VLCSHEYLCCTLTSSQPVFNFQDLSQQAKAVPAVQGMPYQASITPLFQVVDNGGASAKRHPAIITQRLMGGLLPPDSERIQASYRLLRICVENTKKSVTPRNSSASAPQLPLPAASISSQPRRILPHLRISYRPPPTSLDSLPDNLPPISTTSQSLRVLSCVLARDRKRWSLTGVW